MMVVDSVRLGFLIILFRKSGHLCCKLRRKITVAGGVLSFDKNGGVVATRANIFGGKTFFGCNFCDLGVIIQISRVNHIC
jgi:hypothetical protein